MDSHFPDRAGPGGLQPRQVWRCQLAWAAGWKLGVGIERAGGHFEATRFACGGDVGFQLQQRARARKHLGGLRRRPGGERRPGHGSGLHFRQGGLKVSFKIIDDWTEGAAALATNNVDVMLTTADVWAKDYAQFQEKGFGAHAFYMVDWSRGADGVIGKQGINSIEDLAGKTVAFAPYTPSHFLLWNGLQELGLEHRTAQRDFLQGRAHQGRHRARHAVRAAESGCRRGLGPGHERCRRQARGIEEDLRHAHCQPADCRHSGGERPFCRSAARKRW